MDIFLKSTATILIAVILGLALSKQEKDFALLLTVSVCCIVITATVHYLQPIVNFLSKLEALIMLESNLLGILLKTVGISMIAEIASLICADAGNATLGKVLQYMAATVILWMSMPLFEGLITLIENILGTV